MSVADTCLPVRITGRPELRRDDGWRYLPTRKFAACLNLHIHWSGEDGRTTVCGRYARVYLLPSAVYGKYRFDVVLCQALRSSDGMRMVFS
ncbi:hypothetical protein [Mycobacterium sp. GA-2829]|uniref:hypothetical protein n=1 Tax=Mycobacterium sp. GA-2829 TaxID=1772283 RepID=UPI0012FBA514|nr:hypothetical protein [Mycobacterium sp. GA-2829]